MPNDIATRDPQAPKPHLGKIEQWTKHHRGQCVSFITGVFIGHPDFHGTYGHTSMVIKYDGNEIETLNSRYTLGEPQAVLSEDALMSLMEKMGAGKDSL